MAKLLLAAVFVIATCGLLYELVAGTLASYLLGDSVTQFSTIIGLYLFSMGIGSFLSRFVKKNETDVFVSVEIAVGAIGGWSAALLFVMFESVESFRLVLYSVVAVIGILVGIEIPLLMRLLRNRYDFNDLVSRVFALDYVGALLASLLFPLILVPHLGLIRSAQLFGLLNVGVGLLCIYVLRAQIKNVFFQTVVGCLVVLSLLIGFVQADEIMRFSESLGFSGKVVFSKSSSYQHLTVTNANGEWRLYLNGNLQFSSRDEYRYHEALVHVGLAAIEEPKTVLVLGGGDGMAVREILKYPSVEKITLVDLDKTVTDLFVENPQLSVLNKDSLKSEKLEIINADAYQWLRTNQKKFDFVVVDFPDPTSFAIGKLYSTNFYQYLIPALSDKGMAAIQSSSPMFARNAFWCVVNTIQSLNYWAAPYHTYVPSFGEWGFVLTAKNPKVLQWHFPDSLAYLNATEAAALFHFPKDMAHMKTEVNKLNNQALVRYFEADWSEYVR